MNLLRNDEKYNTTCKQHKPIINDLKMWSRRVAVFRAPTDPTAPRSLGPIPGPQSPQYCPILGHYIVWV